MICADCPRVVDRILSSQVSLGGSAWTSAAWAGLARSPVGIIAQFHCRVGRRV